MPSLERIFLRGDEDNRARRASVLKTSASLYIHYVERAAVQLRYKIAFSDR